MSTDTKRRPTGGRLLTRLAELAVRRRGRMVLAWVAVLVAVLAIAPRVAGDFDEDYSTPGSESKEAAALLAARDSVRAVSLDL
jgi:RND superfamily putative drug exporter